MHALLLPALFALALTLPYSALAAGPVFFMDVCWLGFACLTNAQVLANFIHASFIAASFVSFAVFLVGAALMVFSTGNDTLLQKARGMMQYSLVGLALVVGSYGIYRTIVFILY